MNLVPILIVGLLKICLILLFLFKYVVLRFNELLINEWEAGEPIFVKCIYVSGWLTRWLTDWKEIMINENQLSKRVVEEGKLDVKKGGRIIYLKEIVEGRMLMKWLSIEIESYKRK